MKLICCDRCHAVLPPSKKWKWCKCGNAGGCYLDHSEFVFTAVDPNSARVIGVWNGVRYGLVKEGNAFVIPLESHYLKVIPYDEAIDQYGLPSKDLL